ncbi:hypothetical protein RND71_022365 [Anisodus tanguticus]|uniref:Uncharacterized protein n=1 Tax=Anisodus tanguticus TaxID=243964 RepID=A0AAE1VDP7_9SOLA|nr:hypothetical protein RND71_022365 [Anisodus tanguticus]
MRTLLDDHNDLTGDIVVKSGMGNSFDIFRGTLKELELEDFFRASYFGYFLNFPKRIVAQFSMKMVYGLLKRLRCYTPPESLPTFTLKKPAQTIKSEPTNKGKGTKGKKDVDLVDLLRKSCKEKQLLEHLKSITVSRKPEEPICLICLRRTERHSISIREAWAFEVIPHLWHQVKDYSKKISCPRILRWLAAKSNTFITLNILQQFKVELAGVTTVTRESSSVNGVVVDGASVGDGDYVCVGVSDGVGGVDDVVAGIASEKN